MEILNYISNHIYEFLGVLFSIIYVKDDNLWQKDNEQKKLMSAINLIQNKKDDANIKNIELTLPFPRLSWEESMRRFGTDRPDTRYGMELVV